MKRIRIMILLAMILLMTTACTNRTETSFSDSNTRPVTNQEKSESTSAAEKPDIQEATESTLEADITREPSTETDKTEESSEKTTEPESDSPPSSQQVTEDAQNPEKPSEQPKEETKPEPDLPKPTEPSPEEETEPETEPMPEETEPETEAPEVTEPVLYIDSWIAFGKEYAQSIGLSLHPDAVDCWDTPITATDPTYLERDIKSRLNRYAKSGDIIAVWLWAEDDGKGGYLLYIGYS